MTCMSTSSVTWYLQRMIWNSNFPNHEITMHVTYFEAPMQSGALLVCLLLLIYSWNHQRRLWSTHSSRFLSMTRTSDVSQLHTYTWQNMYYFQENSPMNACRDITHLIKASPISDFNVSWDSVIFDPYKIQHTHIHNQFHVSNKCQYNCLFVVWFKSDIFKHNHSLIIRLHLVVTSSSLGDRLQGKALIHPLYTSTRRPSIQSLYNTHWSTDFHFFHQLPAVKRTTV